MKYSYIIFSGLFSCILFGENYENSINRLVFLLSDVQRIQY